MLYLFSMLIFFAGSANLYAGMHTEIVEYRHDDTMLEGYLAYDDEVKGIRPAVLVVHLDFNIINVINIQARSIPG